jgi:hypothetical protein
MAQKLFAPVTQQTTDFSLRELLLIARPGKGASQFFKAFHYKITINGASHAFESFFWFS